MAKKTKKPRSKCSHCRRIGHNARTCPNPAKKTKRG